MARSPRLDAAGAWHHVMNRGARRAPIFDDDVRAGTFVHALGSTAMRFDLEVHGYAVMPNHFHLLVRSVRGNLSRAMRHLGASFTQDVNRQLGWDGPVFRGRFRNQLIHGEAHLLTVSAYIHLNPIRARIIRRFDQHAWTSLRAFLELEVPPVWLHRESILELAGGPEAYTRILTDLRQRRRDWPEPFDLDSGWWRGSDNAPPWTMHLGNVRDRTVREQPATAAEVLVRVEAVTGMPVPQLRQADAGRRGNPARRFAAWALARATDLTQREIGGLLGMTAPHVAMTLRRFRGDAGGKVGEWVDAWLEEEVG